MAITDSTGTLTSQQRYLPFGQVRTDLNGPRITQTDFGYTGQRDIQSLGLYDYHARMYDPGISQFQQPDPIIPDLSNPQTLNRYSYVFNRPINLNDPSGYIACSDAYEFCGSMVFDGKITVSILRRALHQYGVTLIGNWDLEHANAIYFGVTAVGDDFASARGKGETATEAFTAVYGYIDITWDKNCYNCRTPKQIRQCGNNFEGECSAGGGLTTGAHSITFATMAGDNANDMFRSVQNVVHELGHAYSNLPGSGPVNNVPDWILKNRADILRPNIPCDDCFGWQQNRTPSEPETFGDMFLAWTFNAWNTDPKNADLVVDAQTWMNTVMNQTMP